MNNIDSVIMQHADPVRAKNNEWFFKTGPGQYGEGDKFVGLTVPVCRAISKQFSAISLSEIQKLLDNPFHEKRLIGLMILTGQFEQLEKAERKKMQKGTEKNEREKKDTEKRKKEIVDFYLNNARRGRINNWDLIDLSCHKIVGAWLADKDRALLYKLAKSKSLWEKRIAIVSTARFISNKELKDTLAISELLMDDSHDLIHKATGWMLREVGKKDEKTLIKFLDKHAHHMPRTMLRYSIEKFDEKTRKHYLELKNKR